MYGSFAHSPLPSFQSPNITGSFVKHFHDFRERMSLQKDVAQQREVFPLHTPVSLDLKFDNHLGKATSCA